jgi:hypothetical protein
MSRSKTVRSREIGRDGETRKYVLVVLLVDIAVVENQRSLAKFVAFVTGISTI